MSAVPRNGSWVFVCGPSGSGKDSVIACAQQTLTDRTDIVFSRRFITRPAQTGSDHDPLGKSAFTDLLQAGNLGWHWEAHGFSYGIARHYEDAVQAGCVVVVNGSREHVNGLSRSADVRVVHITASQHALAQRLLQRGRDTAAAVTRRLARNAHFDGMPADCVIANDGELAQAGQQLAHYLAAMAPATPSSTTA